MTPSFATLLLHTADVPRAARLALEAAHAAPEQGRALALRSAARSLYRETELDCAEALDIVGLKVQEAVCD